MLSEKLDKPRTQNNQRCAITEISTRDNYDPFPILHYSTTVDD
jgi:hypothetical protein